MANEALNLKGRFEFKVFNQMGVLKDDRLIYNVITNTGKAAVAGLILADVAGTAFDYIAIGTSTASASATDTALGGEVYRITGTGTRVTSTASNDTAQLIATLTSTGTHGVTEAAVFNASSAGAMLCRQTFSVINVTSGDSVQITYKITVT